MPARTGWATNTEKFRCQVRHVRASYVPVSLELPVDCDCRHLAVLHGADRQVVASHHTIAARPDAGERRRLRFVNDDLAAFELMPSSSAS